MSSVEHEQILDDDLPSVITHYSLFNRKIDDKDDSDSLDNKSSSEQNLLTLKMDHLTNAEMECEKLKIQVTDLKLELKICRQKIGALENELAEAKRKENEHVILLEQQKNNSNKILEPNETLEKEIMLLRTRNQELKNETEDLKLTVKKLEANLKEIQKKDKVADGNNQLNRIGEVMEKSMARLMAENEQAIRERDIAQMHLANAESAFSDVHQKYENCKLQVQILKNSDESLRRDIAVNEDTIQKQEQKYEALKSFAMGQVEKYNQELIMMKKNYEAEIARVTAQMKRYEIKSNSLMEALQQKSKECEQLTAVYDEMIGKV